MIQRRVIVSGRVQGVFFRKSTLQQARRHPEVRGYVRNLDDGRVEAVFCGPEDAVLDLVAWCRQGPPAADVQSLEVNEEDPDPGLGGFAIRH